MLSGARRTPAPPQRSEGSALRAAHSETVVARARMPLRQRKQDFGRGSWPGPGATASRLKQASRRGDRFAPRAVTRSFEGSSLVWWAGDLAGTEDTAALGPCALVRGRCPANEARAASAAPANPCCDGADVGALQMPGLDSKVVERCQHRKVHPLPQGRQRDDVRTDFCHCREDRHGLRGARRIPCLLVTGTVRQADLGALSRAGDRQRTWSSSGLRAG